MTNWEYLDSIVNYLNSVTDRKYKMTVLTLKINYKAVGILGTITKEEVIVAIVSSDFDEKTLSENIIGEPESFEHFYENRKFIYCFGPYENVMEILKVLAEPAIIQNFYGLEGFFDELIKDKGFSKSYKIINNVWYHQ